MKKEGFTLIELLAVIVILAIIALITTYTVNSIIENARKSLSDTQKENIEEAAKTYYLKEGMNTNDTCVSVDELIEKGYIEKSEVLDPKDKEKMTGYVKITYASNQYSYEYQENSCE